MTLSDGVKVATRLVVLYLLFWIVTDLVSLPREIASLLYELRTRTSGRPTHDVYYLRSSILYLTGNVLLIALWSLLAMWFYRCGPVIQRFFGVSQPPCTKMTPKASAGRRLTRCGKAAPRPPASCGSAASSAWSAPSRWRGRSSSRTPRSSRPPRSPKPPSSSRSTSSRSGVRRR